MSHCRRPRLSRWGRRSRQRSRDGIAVFSERVSPVLNIPRWRDPQYTALPVDYISEDELNTYDDWLKYQAIDLSSLSDEHAAAVRELFDDAMRARTTARKVGRMKQKLTGESRYAIAIRDGADLWLALWIKQSSKSEFSI